MALPAFAGWLKYRQCLARSVCPSVCGRSAQLIFDDGAWRAAPLSGLLRRRSTYRRLKPGMAKGCLALISCPPSRQKPGPPWPISSLVAEPEAQVARPMRSAPRLSVGQKTTRPDRAPARWPERPASRPSGTIRRWRQHLAQFQEPCHLYLECDSGTNREPGKVGVFVPLTLGGVGAAHQLGPACNPGCLAEPARRIR
jgi:hypothetical protein